MANKDNAQAGKGVQVLWWNDEASPPAYESVGKIRSVSGFGRSRAEIESDTLDSEEGEYVSGLRRGKVLNIVTTTTGAAMELAENWQDRESVDLKLVWPTPTNRTRYCAAVPIDDDQGTIAPNTLMEQTIQARITGGIKLTDPHGA